MQIRRSVWIVALPALAVLAACGSTFEVASEAGSEGGGDSATSLDSTATDTTPPVDAAGDMGKGSAPDTGPTDTGLPDTRVTDTGIVDTGPKDTGAPDACAKTCSDLVCPVGEHCCASIEVEGCALCITGTGDICPG
jgi:hypothetical protein